MEPSLEHFPALEMLDSNRAVTFHLFIHLPKNLLSPGCLFINSESSFLQNILSRLFYSVLHNPLLLTTTGLVKFMYFFKIKDINVNFERHFRKQSLCKQVTKYEIKNIGQFQYNVVSRHYIVKEEEMGRE